MTSPEEDRLERLVLECLEADDPDLAVENACVAHPDLAARLRRVVERMGRHSLFREEAADVPAETTGFALPERVGKYRLGARLGEGGMGVVFRARDLELERDVAVKVVRPELLWFDKARERFAREIDAVARLQDPGIVGIHAFGEQDGLPYFVMDLVDGGSLAERLEIAAGVPRSERDASVLRFGDAPLARGSGTTDVSRRHGGWAHAVVSLLREVALSLQHAHERGVLHRDVKPSNILVDGRGQPILVDFGLARVEGAGELTRSYSQLGSLSYAPPESFSGDPSALTVTSDVYSLGVTLYEALTLHNPFTAKTADETRRRIERGDVPTPRKLDPSVDADLASVVLRAIDPDPARRYPTMAGFAADLAAVLEHRPVEASRSSWSHSLRRFVRRRPVAAVSALSALLLFVVVPIGVAVWQAGVARQMRSLASHAERQGYLASITAAASAVRDASSSAAVRALELAPERLRAWEWRHLAWRADRSDARWEGAATLADFEFADDAATRVVGVERDGSLWMRRAADGTLLASAELGFSVEGIARVASDDRLWVVPRARPVVVAVPFGADGFGPAEDAHALPAPATRLRAARDRSSVAVGLQDGQVLLLDGDGQRLESFTTDGGPFAVVIDLAFDPTGRALAAAVGSGVWVFELGAGASSGRRMSLDLPGETTRNGLVQSVLWTGEHELLAVDTDGLVRRIDVRSGTSTRFPERLAGPLWLRDGDLFGTRDGGVRSVSLEDGHALAPIRLGHRAPIFRVLPLPGGTVWTAGHDGAVCVFGAHPPWEVWRSPDGPRSIVDEVAASGRPADGLFVATAPGTLRRLDAMSGAELETHAFGERIVDLEASGDAVAVVFESGEVRVRVGPNPDFRTLPSAAAGPEWRAGACAWQDRDDDGARLLWVAGRDGALASFRVPEHGAELHAVVTSDPDSDSRPEGLALSLVLCDDTLPVAVLSGGDVVAWPPGQGVRSIGNHPEGTDLVAHPEGGARVLTAGYDGKVRLWNVDVRNHPGGDESFTWSGQLLTRIAATGSGEHARIFVGTMRGRVRCYDLRGRLLTDLEGHSRGVFALGFFPVLDALVSGSWDGTLRTRRASD